MIADDVTAIKVFKDLIKTKGQPIGPLSEDCVLQGSESNV
jgi:hypothetical protein